MYLCDQCGAYLVSSGKHEGLGIIYPPNEIPFIKCDCHNCGSNENCMCYPNCFDKFKFLNVDQLKGKIEVTIPDESLEFAEKIYKQIQKDKRREAGIFITEGKKYHKKKILYAVWATEAPGVVTTESYYKR